MFYWHLNKSKQRRPCTAISWAGSSLVPWLLPSSSSFSVSVVGFVVVVVVVTAETRTESTRAVVSARPEVVWEQPLVVEATITWNIHGCLLHEGVTLDSGALLSSTSVLIDKTISKIAVFVTVIIFH